MRPLGGGSYRKCLVNRIKTVLKAFPSAWRHGEIAHSEDTVLALSSATDTNYLQYPSRQQMELVQQNRSKQTIFCDKYIFL